MQTTAWEAAQSGPWKARAEAPERPPGAKREPPEQALARVRDERLGLGRAREWEQVAPWELAQVPGGKPEKARGSARAEK